MKVVFIYRRKTIGAYSIEELFRTIAGELRGHAEVVEYKTGGRWSLLADLARLWSMRADIYHVTGDVNYLIWLLPGAKTVLTVHDIGHYLFSLRGGKRLLYRWLWLLWPIRAAGAVTAVSEATRTNIVKHLGIAGERVATIENCHSPRFQSVPRPFNADCPVILQVGTRPYKNVPRLIAALRGIRCRLLLVGRLDAALRRLLLEAGIDYLNRVDLSHDQLYRQYLECDLVAFVSVGEGFGLPIIEAQASGRPLLTSDLSPLKEVAGEGACLVDPLNVEAIRAGILKIIADADYRARLITHGLQNVERYSPSVVSAKYLRLYERVLTNEARVEPSC